MEVTRIARLSDGGRKESAAAQFSADNETEEKVVNVYNATRQKILGFGGAFTDSAAYNYSKQHPVKRDASGYPLVHEYYEEEYEPDFDLEFDENSDFVLEQTLTGQLGPTPGCVSCVKEPEPEPKPEPRTAPLSVQQKLQAQGVAPEVAKLADADGIIDAHDVRAVYVHPAQTKLNAMDHLNGATNNAWGEDWFDDVEPDLKDDSCPIEQDLVPYNGVSPDPGPSPSQPLDGQSAKPFQASLEQLIKPRQSSKRGFAKSKKGS